VKPVSLDLDAIPKRPRVKAPQGPIRKHAYWKLIIRSLRVDGPQTEASLAKNLVGIHEDTIHFTLKYYLGKGVLERVGRKYKLTERYADFAKPRKPRPRRPAQKRPTAWTKVGSDD
jgi:hypothetical protein